MANLARLSHRHISIMEWLILNPERSLRECADHFQISQPWLSTLIHSDMFQHALKERQVEVAIAVTQSIPTKLAAAADIAVEKLAAKLAVTEDPDYILDATDKILHRMGYAPSSARNPAGNPLGFGPTAQQNNFFISASDLNEARGLMQEAARLQLPPVELPGEFQELARDGD